MKNAAQKGRWLNASARKGKTPGSNRGRRSETAICIYGLKEKIRARKSPETVDAPGFTPDASTVSLIWYARLDSNQRPTESELSGRQAGKPCGARVWLVLHKFPPLWRKTSEALSSRASEVFHGSSQIVVCAPRRSYDSVQLSTPTPVSYCTKTAYPARLRCGSELRSVGCVGRRSSTSGSPCPLRSGRTSRRCPLQPSPHGA